MLWDWDGALARIHHMLYIATREREGREASPTAAIIDSQSAKAAQKGALRGDIRQWAHEGWSSNPVFLAQYQRIIEGLRMAGLPEK